VIEVGPTRRIENLSLARQAIEVSADGRVVMPGFVDSHTHLLFPVPGTPCGDPEASLHSLRATTSTQLKMRASAYLQAMVRHGTTTVEIKTGCGTANDAEMKILRVIAELQKEPPEVVSTFLFRPPPISDIRGQSPERPWRHVSSEFLPRISRRGLIGFADLAWHEFTNQIRFQSTEWAAWPTGYLQVARSLGLGRKLHADGERLAGAIAAAVQHHATSIDHLEHATAGDAAALGQSNVVVTLLPCASFYEEERYAPARAFVDAGAPLALASDFNPRRSPSLSMQTVVSLACLRMGLTPEEAISAATINGAYALGRGELVGSLECGKLANLLLLNVSDYRELAHSLGANLVRMVMRRGEIVYEEGRVGPRPVEDLRPLW